MAQRPGVLMDFEFLWRGARHWADGRDPYALRPWVRGWPLPDRLFYPFPALLTVWPLHWLSLPAAAAVFVSIPAGIVAWQLTRTSLWPLLALATPSFVLAAILGQWSPWFLVAMQWPLLGFLFTCKPTLGLACLTFRPTRSAVVGCAVLVLLSLALWPRWPLDWLHNLKSVSEHPAPIMTPTGVLLGLAALRWRQREARLLIAMALVPQLLFFADQLPLMLVARNRREALLLALGGWLSAGFWFVHQSAEFGAVLAAAPYVMAGVYLPALWIVLRRPNEGPLPAWLERQLSLWPAWLRGAPVSTRRVVAGDATVPS